MLESILLIECLLRCMDAIGSITELERERGKEEKREGVRKKGKEREE